MHGVLELRDQETAVGLVFTTRIRKLPDPFVLAQAYTPEGNPVTSQRVGKFTTWLHMAMALAIFLGEPSE